jgi:hypothetical protein
VGLRSSTAINTSKDQTTSLCPPSRAINLVQHPPRIRFSPQIYLEPSSSARLSRQYRPSVATSIRTFLIDCELWRRNLHRGRSITRHQTIRGAAIAAVSPALSDPPESFRAGVSINRGGLRGLLASSTELGTSDERKITFSHSIVAAPACCRNREDHGVRWLP